MDSGEAVTASRVRVCRALDLFTGTGSVKQVLEEEGWSVTTLDADPQWSADIVEDILEWDYRQVSPHRFDLITASPPCIEFSRAKTTKARDLDHADRVVQKVF